MTSLLLLLALGAARASALRCPMDSGLITERSGSESGLPSHHSAPHHEHGGAGSSERPAPMDVDCDRLMTCGVAAAPSIVLSTFEAGELLSEPLPGPSISLESIYLDIRIPPPRP